MLRHVFDSIEYFIDVFYYTAELSGRIIWHFMVYIMPYAVCGIMLERKIYDTVHPKHYHYHYHYHTYIFTTQITASRQSPPLPPIGTSAITYITFNVFLPHRIFYQVNPLDCSVNFILHSDPVGLS